MFAVMKKEFKTYFLSPIGYVVVGILLLICSAFFYFTSVQTGSVDLGTLYYYTAFYGLIMTAPILTMRMFAEERKSGTEQLLLTSPISITKIVLGKMFAALGVILISLIISLMYYVIVLFFAEINIVPVLVSMLGFILISLAAISIGMFTSSITENQVISAIITIAFLILSSFLEAADNFFSKLSITGFYIKFPAGIISVNEIVALLTFTISFVLMTILVLQRRKCIK